MLPRPGVAVPRDAASNRFKAAGLVKDTVANLRESAEMPLIGDNGAEPVAIESAWLSEAVSSPGTEGG